MTRSIQPFNIRGRDHARTTLPAVGRDIHKMSLRHPELIQVSMVASDNESGMMTSMTCDTDAMRSKQLFRNALVNNDALHAEYYEQVFTAIDPQPDALLVALEKKLGSRESGGARQ